MVDKSSWFDKLTPEVKLSQDEISVLADKYIPRFYAGLVFPFCFAYIGFRSLIEPLPPEVHTFMESDFVMPLFAITFMISFLFGYINMSQFESKAYGKSIMSRMQVFGDIRVKHWKPMLIVPVFGIIFESLMLFFT